MGTFRNLVAWQVAMELVDAVYLAVRSFPKSELFGLGQQMRSAAVSIPSNIAESRGRFSRAEEHQFLRHARGSTYELHTQIEIAMRQEFIDAPTAANLTKLADSTGRLINALLKCDPPKKM
jgi:four helix bundle protein